MMKDVLIDDTMSNLTSASNEASLSSNNIKQSSSTSNPSQRAKRKRNPPGNPDPEAEVIALSPRTLMATNRFICEICNKGFQRDQNLQLHRRGHNLPWKLKQRNNKEVIKKKVYVCPETTCVHHEASRALGDLTGIKKHYCRKHGEKKWKCQKCSKRYAVQSDWKAHSKICGTREYRCDCGTLFSRRDSFVTHRAFCDALTQETSRTITANPLLKTEHEFQQRFNPRPEMPSWLVSESTVQARQLGPIPTNYIPSSSLLDHQAIIIHDQENPNPNPPHMSATALLQKAEQMGVTMSSKTSHQQHDHMILTGRPHKALHHMMSGNGFDSTTCGGSGIGLPSREEIGNVLIHGLASYGNNKAAIINSSAACTEQQNKLSSTLMPSSTSRFQELAFQDSFNEMMNQKSESNFEDEMFTNSTSGQDCLTRDFLGVRAFPHTDFLNMSSLDHQIGSSSQNQTQNQPPRRS